MAAAQQQHQPTGLYDVQTAAAMLFGVPAALGATTHPGLNGATPPGAYIGAGLQPNQVAALAHNRHGPAMAAIYGGLQTTAAARAGGHVQQQIQNGQLNF